MSRIKITPDVYKMRKDQYLEALAARREEITQQLKKGKPQQQVADYWNVNIKVVNRIYKTMERKDDK